MPSLVLGFLHQLQSTPGLEAPKRKVAQRNDPAYERERIGELAEFIEFHLLDELADQRCVEGFCLNARAGLEREVPRLEAFKKSWCTAAARQVWYKYNH